MLSKKLKHIYKKQNVKTFPMKKNQSWQDIYTKYQKIDQSYEKRFKIFLKKKNSILSFPDLLTKSVDTIRPYLSVRKVRRRGRTYYLPYFLPLKWSRKIAIKWIREAATRKRKTSQSSGKALGQSFLEGIQNSGYALQKKEELHKLAIGNRTYARFRWW